MLRLLVKLKIHLNSIKIKKQLLLVYSLAGIIPILLLGAYLIGFTQNMVMKQHISQVKAENVRIRNIIFNVTNTLSNLGEDICNDKQLQQLVSRRYDSPSECYEACRSYLKMVNYQNNYAEIGGIGLYVNNPTMTQYGAFKIVDDSTQQSDWFQAAIDSVGGTMWVSTEVKDDGNNASTVLTLVRKVQIIHSDSYAVLRIDVSNNYLRMLINTSSLKTEAALIDSPLFFTNLSQNTGQPLGVEPDPHSNYNYYIGVGMYNNVQTLYEISTLYPASTFSRQGKMYIATLDNEALPDRRNVLLVSLAILFVSLLIPLITIILFSNTFSRRITLLRDQMHRVSGGDYNIIENLNGNDEVHELFLDLQTMIEEIKGRDAEIYNQKLAKEKLSNHQHRMEFEMLASQINPHFLYNTLESIRMKAHSAGDRDVATAIKLLGKSMHHVLETNGNPTPLKSELEYIQTYLEIQKFRFGEKISYEIRVHPDINAESYKILPLLIQPLVENAIIHGLDEKESGGFISITAAPENERMVISVLDNGDGMSGKQLVRLLAKVHSPVLESSKTSIGMQNISHRIKLFYGNDYGISIESILHKGTTVRIILPLNYQAPKEGSDEPESIDRG